MKIVFVSMPKKAEQELNAIKDLITKFYDKVRFIESSNKVDFEALLTADMAFFAYDWQLSERCILEHEICKRYGIEIIRD